MPTFPPELILILSIGLPFTAFVVVAKAKSEAKGTEAKDCEKTVLTPLALEIPIEFATLSLKKAELVFVPVALGSTTWNLADGEEGERLGLDKEGIYAALVNAIKEQQAQIKELQKEIEILKNK